MKALKLGCKRILALMALFLITGWFSEAKAYDAITNIANNVTIDVTPVQLVPGKPIKFVIRLNTHSVPLVFDLVAVSTLRDDSGGNYQPVNWQGSPPGGHHRSGVLEFPILKSSSKTIKLIIREVAGVPERIFEWRLEK